MGEGEESCSEADSYSGDKDIKEGARPLKRDNIEKEEYKL